MAPWGSQGRPWIARILVPLIVFSAVMALISVLILDPLAVALAQALVALQGEPFAGNFDLVPFLLTPIGLLTTLVIVGAVILLAAVEFGGLTLIAWSGLNGQPTNARTLWLHLGARLPALLVLTAFVFLLALALLAPVGAAALAAKRIWLSGGDIYFYVSTRPPGFYYAAAFVGAAAVAAAAAGLVLALRWFLAVPFCVLGGASTMASLGMSAAATRGRRASLFLRLLAWAGITLVLSAGATAVFSVLFSVLLVPEQSLVVGTRMTLALALAGGVLAALVSAISRALFAMLATEFYATAGEGKMTALAPGASAGSRAPRLTSGLICLAVPLAAAVQTLWALEAFDLDRPVEVTAHRAGSRAAPENTLAALERAIAAKADFAEIDVQETSDGEVVVLHDTDLRRVAGLARPIWEMTSEEIRRLDAGSWFSPDFKDERIPTLREIAGAAKGRIRLNVELKVNGHGVDLAGRTLAILNETGVGAKATVSSLDLPILTQVRAIDPDIQIGFIASTGVGNLAALDVDFYSLAARIATPPLIRRLTEAGREVHVWTLNSETAIVDAILDGATNVSTDDPAMARGTVDSLAEMSAPEFALLRLRRMFERKGLLRPV